MNNKELIAAQVEASRAFEAGAKLAERTSKMEAVSWSDPSGKDLGKLLGNPGAFWAKAATIEAFGDCDAEHALLLVNKVASVQMAIGNLGFVRESLIGQAQWLGVVAIKMMMKADRQKDAQRAAQAVKLALTAQRQAAQCLASAAALERLGEVKTITGARLAS